MDGLSVVSRVAGNAGSKGKRDSLVTSILRRRTGTLVASAVLAILLPGSSAAAAHSVEVLCDAELEGQWDGPYRLQSQINPPGKAPFVKWRMPSCCRHPTPAGC